MATIKASAIVQEVLDHHFSARYSTRIYTWIDKAQKKIIRRTNVRTNEETAELPALAGDSTLTLPSNYARLISLTLGDDEGREPLQQVDQQTFDLYNNTTVTGTTYAYMISENLIYLLPSTDIARVFYLRYWRMPEDVTSITNDVEIPADYSQLIVDYCLHRAYLSEHDTKLSEHHRQLWENGLAEMRAEMQGDHEGDGPIVTPGTWSNLSSSFPRVYIP